MATATASPPPSAPNKPFTARGKSAPTEEQIKFETDLAAFDARLDVVSTSFRPRFGEAGEEEAWKAEMVPLLFEVKTLYASQGQQGGVGFLRWMKKHRAQIKIGRTTAGKWLIEAGLQAAPTPRLPHLGEYRIINSKVGKIVELPALEDGKDADGQAHKQQMKVHYLNDKADVEPDTYKLATQKKHILSIDTVYIKPNGERCRYADGKLLTVLTAVQVTAHLAALQAVKKVKTVKKAKNTTKKAKVVVQVAKLLATASPAAVEQIEDTV
jgi:hypothetical protein